jgi:beta-lactam-binding protein with PASTA domain
MAKNPDDRYRSAEELRADLLRFADGRPVEAADPGVTSMMTAVGATTQAVPTATGRTMAVPVKPGPPPEDLERKKRTRRLIALLIGLLVALAVIAFFLLRSLGVFGGDVKVPDLVGLTTAAATQTLQNDNLTLGTTTFRTSTTAKGLVLSTNPKSGTSVGKNSAVSLVVSNGPNVPIVAVPDVVGDALATAIQKLGTANLNYTVKTISSNQPQGTVLSQIPSAGSHVRQTVPVQLTVSGTQTSVLVPSVLGQSPTAAGGTLARAGLTVGSQSSECSNGYASGQVSAQNPGSGASVPPNTPVNVAVSNGPCVPVPSVIGQSQSSASAAVSAANLVPNFTTDTTCANGAQPGTVDSQTPAGGAQVQSGSTVNMSVCSPTTTTTTTPSSTTSSTSTTTTNPQ